MGKRLRTRTETTLFDERLNGDNSDKMVNGQHEMGHTHTEHEKHVTKDKPHHYQLASELPWLRSTLRFI